MKKLLFILSIAVAAVLIAATPAKKNVLIIGDSISIGYTPFVASSMADVANVVHHKGNAQTSTNCIEKVDEWLGDTKWDVIHFNCGLWDLCYRHPEAKNAGNRDKVNGTLSTTVKQYSKNLEALVERLEQTGAKLVFATTTYVPTKEVGRFPEDVAIYNKAALKVMKRHKITVDPLYDLSLSVHKENGLGEDNVHYNKVGYEELSKQVVKYIEQKL